MTQHSVTTFTGQQEDALAAIAEWFNSGASPVFRLFGPAGVGKTTIARAIPGLLGANAIYGAYTGKAAHVLNRKGCAPARTLHSLIYIPTASAYRAELTELRRRSRNVADPDLPAINARLALVEQLASQPGWKLNESSDLLAMDLLICDEVSMVNQEMAIDLLSFDRPIVVLGDPEQLPPIKGEGFFTSAAADFTLTEIHRQSEASPILSLATRIRQGGHIQPHEYATSTSTRDLLAVDQVLCGTNRTRWGLIEELRAARGLPPGFPVPGDRLICLTNNRELGIFNGQQFTVMHNAGQDGGQRAWALTLTSDDGTPYDLSAFFDGFTGQAGQDLLKGSGFRGRVASMTFADAITVHKAQGSEWPSVALVDESGAFAYRDPDTGRRWAYTGITRAAEQLMIVGRR